jgi:hypothetical protein
MFRQEKADNHQTSYVQIDNVATGGPQGCSYADDVDADSVGQPDAVDALAVRVAGLDLLAEEEMTATGGFVLQYRGDGSHLPKEVRDLMNQGYELVGAVLPFDDEGTGNHDQDQVDTLNPEDNFSRKRDLRNLAGEERSGFIKDMPASITPQAPERHSIREESTTYSQDTYTPGKEHNRRPDDDTPVENYSEVTGFSNYPD